MKKIKQQLSSLQNRITLLTIAGVVLSCLVVGIFSFLLARQALIKNVSNNNANTLKQISSSLDERLLSIRNLSFLMSQDSEIAAILKASTRELSPVELSQQTSSFKRIVLIHAANTSFIEDAFLTDTQGRYTRQYRAFSQKAGISSQQVQTVIGELDPLAQVQWQLIDGQTFLIRRITDINSGSALGYLCIQLASSFFAFDSISDLLTDNDITVFNRQQEKLKADQLQLSQDWPSYFHKHNLSRYATFSSQLKTGGGSYIINVANLKNEDWSVMGLTSTALVSKAIQPIILAMIGGLFILSGLLIYFSYRLTKSISGNVQAINTGIQAYENGNLLAKITPTSNDELGRLALQFNKMGDNLNELIFQLNRQQEIKNQLEFQTLKAQINPHFLYNSLESIRWFAFNQNQPEVTSAIDSLINLLKITIKNSTSMITLAEELKYVQNYLNLQKMRYGDDLAIKIVCEPASLPLLIPGFILQPFIENSIVHGMDFSQQQGQITVEIQQQENYLQIWICDNGVGISQENIAKIYSTLKHEPLEKKGFNGLGVPIIIERLRHFFEDDFEFEIFGMTDGTKIKLRLPVVD